MDSASDNTEKGELGERFVNEIAFNSFLKYWCYPGPLDIAKDNKEICDLLVVFKSACLIISVKNYSFKGNYERYFRSTTDRAIRQIHGAEKTLFRDQPVLLKHPDRAPEGFRRQDIRNVYRIVINLNTGVKVYQTALFDRGKEIIVMDAEAWQSAIKELDTLPDFLNYINKRALLTKKGPAIILPREEFNFSQSDGEFLAKLMFSMPKEGNFTLISGTELDLIATYYKNGMAFPKALQSPKFNARSLKIDGEWNNFFNSAIFNTKRELETPGYFVDEIVKEMIIDQNSGDKLAKMLFSLNRMRRSYFAGHFSEFHAQQSRTSYDHRPYYYAKYNPKMVFLYFKEDLPDERLRDCVNLYLLHMNYIFDYKLEEIGLIGKAKDSSRYAFGYTSNSLKPTLDEIKKLESRFSALNLKLRSDYSPIELEDIELPHTPLFESPF